jgi:hypothetical protein
VLFSVSPIRWLITVISHLFDPADIDNNSVEEEEE